MQVSHHRRREPDHHSAGASVPPDLRAGADQLHHRPDYCVRVIPCRATNENYFVGPSLQRKQKSEGQRRSPCESDGVRSANRHPKEPIRNLEQQLDKRINPLVLNLGKLRQLEQTDPELYLRLKLTTTMFEGDAFE